MTVCYERVVLSLDKDGLDFNLASVEEPDKAAVLLVLVLVELLKLVGDVFQLRRQSTVSSRSFRPVTASENFDSEIDVVILDPLSNGCVLEFLH